MYLPGSRFHRSTVAVVCVYAVVQTCVWAAKDPLNHKLPVMEVIPGMHLEWIAEQIVMNGLPMSIRGFTSDKTPDEVLQFYERKWKARGLAQTAKSDYGDAKTVGMEYRSHYYSVQVEERSFGSEGVLTVSQAFSELNPDKETRFPLAPGSEVVSKVESRDLAARAETLVVTNRSSVASNASYFKTALSRDGWVQQSFAAEAPAGERVLNFQRGSHLCQVTIVKHSPQYPGRTVVLVHWIKGG